MGMGMGVVLLARNTFALETYFLPSFIAGVSMVCTSGTNIEKNIFVLSIVGVFELYNHYWVATRNARKNVKN